MKKRKIIRLLLFSLSLALIVLMVKPTVIVAADPPVPTVLLGDASSFAVLGASTVTNTGTTTIGGTAGGNVGVYPGSAITGTASMNISGFYHVADAVAGLAQTALTAAITDARNRSATTINTELGSTTLFGGVYTSDSGTFRITGELILDGQNDPHSVFIFQMASTLTTGEASSVSLINGANPCNIFWQVGSSATLGTTSNISGHILATASISANAGAIISGSLLASTGAVTLSGNTITNNVCPAATTASLTIVKNVINDDDGTLSAADFNLHVTLNGIDVTGSPAVGSETGEYYVLEPGTYLISEDVVSGYLASFSGASIDGSITLLAGDRATVTVTNNDVTPGVTTATLTIIKHVVNNDGGTLSATDFNLHVRLDGVEVDGSPAVGSETGVVYTLAPGTYVISENAVSGYVASFSGATAEGSVTLIAGDNKTVTITNNDVSNEIPNTGVEDDMILIGGLFLLLSILAWFLSRKKAI